jgi:hypothetical protein
MVGGTLRLLKFEGHRWTQSQMRSLNVLGFRSRGGSAVVSGRRGPEVTLLSAAERLRFVYLVLGRFDHPFWIRRE